MKAVLALLMFNTAALLAQDSGLQKEEKIQEKGPYSVLEKKPEPVNFFGIKATSHRVIFVIDYTGSMLEPASEPPHQDRKDPDDLETERGNSNIDTGGKSSKKEPADPYSKKRIKEIREKYDKREIKTKMDAAKKELINAIYALDPEIYFTIIFYNSAPVAWKNELVQATMANKRDAIISVDGLKPAGRTNIWDALEMAFKLADKVGAALNKKIEEKLKKEHEDKLNNGGQATGKPDAGPTISTGNKPASTPKTKVVVTIDDSMVFYFLTDGEPNLGRIVDKGSILGETRKFNSTNKVKINTITLGDLGADPGFMQSLAAQNGGTSVHIRK